MKPSTTYTNAHWIKLRKSLLDDKNCQCYLCGKNKWVWQPRKEVWRSVRFEIHHLNYDNVGHETESDVKVLCHSCHQLLTDILHRKPSSSFISDLQKVVTNYIEDRAE